jgi:hypothetical protein
MHRFPAIQIGAHTSPTFERDVVEALNTIESAPSGRRLLQSIEGLANREKKVTISEASGGQAPVARPRLTPSQIEKQLSSRPTQEEFNRVLAKNASGSGLMKKLGTASEIPWNKHTAEPNLDSQGRPVAGANPEHAFITLAHELVHAKHHLAGTMKHDVALTPDAACARTESGKEELRAVGLGKYARTGEPSENAIRSELGLPLRSTYARSGNW